eukprot:6251796-Prymnesium_polylepis.1
MASRLFMSTSRGTIALRRPPLRRPPPATAALRLFCAASSLLAALPLGPALVPAIWNGLTYVSVSLIERRRVRGGGSDGPLGSMDDDPLIERRRVRAGGSVPLFEAAAGAMADAVTSAAAAAAVSRSPSQLLVGAAAAAE